MLALRASVISERVTYDSALGAGRFIMTAYCFLPSLFQPRRHPVDHHPHHLTLDEAPHGYDIFKNKEDECVKVVMRVS